MREIVITEKSIDKAIEFYNRALFYLAASNAPPVDSVYSVTIRCESQEARDELLATLKEQGHNAVASELQIGRREAMHVALKAAAKELSDRKPTDIISMTMPAPRGRPSFNLG